MKKFTGLHVNHLNIDNLYGIVKTTVEISIPLQAMMGELPSAALMKLKTIHDDLEQRMKKTFASALTPELVQMNLSRNKVFAEIKRFTTTASKSSSEILHQPGMALKLFLAPYWTTEKEPLNTITGIYEEIFDRYHADSAIQAAVNVLGIIPLMTDLEHINIKYDIVYKQRNAEVGGKTGNPASEIKSEAIQTYEQYCIVIEQSVNISPTDTLLQLFSQIDELRRKYAALQHSKKEEEEGN